MLRERLKEIIAPLHKEVEKSNFLAQNMDIESYKKFLVLMYGFIKPLEDTIIDDEFKNSGVMSFCIKKSDNLKLDIESFGLSINQIELCKSLPDVSNLYKKIGVWYVLEGSMMGNAMQLPLIQKNLNLGEDSTRYFIGYGDKKFIVWSSFVEFLNSMNLSKLEQKDVILSACDTFLSLDAWLDS